MRVEYEHFQCLFLDVGVTLDRRGLDVDDIDLGLAVENDGGIARHIDAS